MGRSFSLAGFFSVAILLTSYPALAQQVHGVLQVVKGDVQIVSAKSGKSEKARVGGKVFPQDVIVTGKDSRAKVVMLDKNELNVSPESRLEIQKYEFQPAAGKKDVLLNVIYGKVRSKVEQKYDGAENKFEVKTPTAVAGVRGTDFLAGYKPETQTSQVVTFKGEVMVGLPGPGGTILNPVSVTPGQFTEVVGNSPPPPPQEMPKEQFASIETESKAEGPGSGPGGGNPDPRAPAGSGQKEKSNENPQNGSPEKSEPRRDGVGGAGGNTGGSAPGAAGAEPGARNSGSANAPGPRPEGPRVPASLPGAPGGSMLRPEDLAGAPNSAVLPTFNQIQPPLPPPTNLPAPIVCEFCTRLIENGNASLLLRVRNPTQSP